MRLLSISLILSLVVGINAFIRSVCNLSLETGPCEALIPRYGFDVTQRKCVLFNYGGCGGNGNNFNTETSCKETCSKINPISNYYRRSRY
ncbi:kunitz-type serine protease inhibitor IX-like [Haematobia irritans]|uniref:kunitz-type serine protease inhibitor IX-like n=1 Tax=Haematobia irritans TaxID=7368 RepID=UPI003F50A355